MTEAKALSHLKALESESIEIFREVAASFERPVMMYSIGKDSSVLLHLARKAFYPEPHPVPAAPHRHHVEVPGDDRLPRPHGGASTASSCIVHTNPEGAGATTSTRSTMARRATPTS